MNHKISPEMQVKPYTSGSTRIIGGVLNVSPIKVESFIKETFGGIGPQILNAIDRALAGLKIIPKDQIGGTSIINAIIARFSKAAGGQGDEKSNKILKDIITKQADDSFRLKQEAELIYKELSQLPEDQANAKADELKQKNPLLYEKLKTVVTDAKQGLNYNDRLIKQLGVVNGERAKFIWESLKQFQTPEEKNDYITDLQDKGIISNNVFEQLKILKQQNP